MKTANINKHVLVLVAGMALSVWISAVRAEVVVVVSPANSVTALSAEQVADIFLGKSSRFPDGNVAVPIDQAENSSERTEFYSRFADKTLAQVKMHWAKLIFTGRGQPPRKAKDAGEVKKLLARNPNAIGYIDRSEVDDTVVVLEIDEPER